VPVSDTPRIYVVDGFATAAECAEIFAAFEPGLEESHTMNADGSRQDDAKGRKSRQHTMGPSRWTPRTTSAVERMDAAAMLPGENGQQLTVTDYAPGDSYQLHVDSTFAIGRVATALLFLRAPEEGGELVFCAGAAATSGQRASMASAGASRSSSRAAPCRGSTSWARRRAGCATAPRAR